MQEERYGMDAKSRWRLALPPPFAVTAGYVIAHVLGVPSIAALVLAGVSGGLSVAVIAVIERQETLRARLPYAAQHLVARRESLNSKRYAQAQTRRFFRVAGGEDYVPDAPTGLAESQRMSRDLTVSPNVVDDATQRPKPSTARSTEGLVTARAQARASSLRYKPTSHAKPNGTSAARRSSQ